MPTPTDMQLYTSIVKKVKTSVQRWPSAYASGQVVSQYKRAFAKKYGKTKNPYIKPKSAKSSLNRWYREKWVNVCRPNHPPCGRESRRGKYPYCRPSKRITNDTPLTVDEVLKKFGKRKLRERCSRKQIIKNKVISSLSFK